MDVEILSQHLDFVWVHEYVVLELGKQKMVENILILGENFEIFLLNYACYEINHTSMALVTE